MTEELEPVEALLSPESPVNSIIGVSPPEAGFLLLPAGVVGSAGCCLLVLLLFVLLLLLLLLVEAVELLLVPLLVVFGVPVVEAPACPLLEDDSVTGES